jgi:hypothetical protein
MKNLNLFLVLTYSIMIASFAVSGQQKTGGDHHEAKLDSAADYNKFRIEAEKKLSDNQKKIGAFRKKVHITDKALQTKYDIEILSLDQRNFDLQKELIKSSDIKTHEWSSFKRDLNNDIMELKNAITEFGVNNPN